jgi:hypothetical protein
MARFIITLLNLFIFVGVSFAQNWDYDSFPNRDIDILHLDGDLRITENGSVEGDLLYSATILVNQTDSLVLHASRLNIIAIEVNNTTADYRVMDDLLIISPDSEFSRGENIQIRVQYDADPQFGLHINERGTIWTSHLPKSTQHWMPVFDHPRTTFTFELAFTHPSDIQIISTGRRGSTDLLSVDEATTLFSSNTPVPATALTWLAGNLNQIGSTVRSIDSASEINLPSGFERRADPQIYVYTETEVREIRSLLEQAADAFIDAANYFRKPFPYQDLHIVLLDHDFMEVKNYGAGVVHVYRNREDLESQIKRGIIAQWAGIIFREEQWQDADAILLLQALAFAELFDDNSGMNDNYTDLPYSSFSDDRFNLWLSNAKSGALSGLISDVKWVQDDFFEEGPEILGWPELANFIYQYTGQNYFEKPQLATIETEEEVFYEYMVQIEWIEDENRIELFFEAISDPVTELVTVEVEEVSYSDNRIHELTFSGESDGVVINISSAVEYVKLSVLERDDVILLQEKPYQFWIAQLRDDDDVDSRVEAARGIAGVTGNPDLQLALNDLLQIELNPEVFAEILRAMARLTAGASGTDERFIRYSSDEQHLLVQKAAIEALAYYRGNERVINRLRNVIIQADDPDLGRSAIRSLAEVTEPDDFANHVQNLVAREDLLNHVPFMLQLLAEMGETERAVELSETFIAPGFPFEVRKDVLRLMIQSDQSSSSWNNRLPVLLADKHPGIRLIAAEALDKLTSQQKAEITEEFVNEEFDARVLELMSR